jgi:hypothetical protein
MLNHSCENAGQLCLFIYISTLNTWNRKYRIPYNMKQITLLLLAILSTINSSAQGLTNYLPALNASIETINSSKDTDDFKDLEVIRRLIQARKVIGLGEATQTIGPMLFPLVDIKINLKSSFDGLLFFRNTNAVTSN